MIMFERMVKISRSISSVARSFECSDSFRVQRENFASSFERSESFLWSDNVRVRAISSLVKTLERSKKKIASNFERSEIF